MNNKLKFILAFSIGAAAGSVVTWKLLKTKYEQIAQAEIESVKEAYSKKFGDEDSEDNTAENPKPVAETESEENEYVDLVQPYISDSENTKKGGSETVKVGTPPYVIPPTDFGEIEYNTITLSYYKDGILADYETNEIIEDIDRTVGLDSLSHFGEYEDNCVYVRNDRLKCDYEILKECQAYSELSGTDESPRDSDNYEPDPEYNE